MDEETQNRIDKIKQDVQDNLRSEASGRMEIEGLMKKAEPTASAEPIQTKLEVMKGEVLEANCIGCGDMATYRVIDPETTGEFYLCRDCRKDHKDHTTPLPLVESQPTCVECGDEPACKVVDGSKVEYLCKDCAEERKDALEEEEKPDVKQYVADTTGEYHADYSWVYLVIGLIATGAVIYILFDATHRGIYVEHLIFGVLAFLIAQISLKEAKRV